MAVTRRTRCLNRSGNGARRRGGGEAFNHGLVIFVLGLFLGSSCGGVLGRPELDHVATLVREVTHATTFPARTANLLPC